MTLVPDPGGNSFGSSGGTLVLKQKATRKSRKPRYLRYLLPAPVKCQSLRTASLHTEPGGAASGAFWVTIGGHFGAISAFRAMKSFHSAGTSFS